MSDQTNLQRALAEGIKVEMEDGQIVAATDAPRLDENEYLKTDHWAAGVKPDPE